LLRFFEKTCFLDARPVGCRPSLHLHLQFCMYMHPSLQQNTHPIPALYTSTHPRPTLQQPPQPRHDARVETHGEPAAELVDGAPPSAASSRPPPTVGRRAWSAYHIHPLVAYSTPLLFSTALARRAAARAPYWVGAMVRRGFTI
jgi:hypothetical protein